MLKMSSSFKPETIKLDGGDEVILEKRSIKNIFKFDSTPYICTAMSGKGKTTLAIDMIYTFAKYCSNIYYITATKESLIDDSISLIPKAFRREPTLENIIATWSEIKSQYNAFNATPEKLNEIIVKMYGEEVTKKINELIEQQKQIIMERNTKLYKSKKYKKEDIALLVKNDIMAFCYELRRRVILYGFKDIKGIDEKLTVEQTNIVNSFVSKNSKSLLILDDITSELNRIKSDKNKILLDDNYVSKAQAFNSVLLDILTRARHFGCIVIFFVHSIDIFNSRENIDNLIMFDSSTAQKLNGIKSFTAKERNLINIASNKIFSNTNYSHMFLYYSRSSQDICVGKASLHNVDKIELSESSKQFLELYENVLSGFKSVQNSNTTDSTKQQTSLIDITDDDEEEESEDGIDVL